MWIAKKIYLHRGLNSLVFYSDAILLVRLSLLRSLYSHAPLILAEPSKFKSQLVHQKSPQLALTKSAQTVLSSPSVTFSAVFFLLSPMQALSVTIPNFVHLKNCSGWITSSCCSFLSLSLDICLTSLTRAKCGTRSTLCWKVGNISGFTELFAL